MNLSVIVPAYNEAACLPETLSRIAAALARATPASETLVVDNDSTDATARIARQSGATVIRETERNIAAVRNAGAARANGDVLVFIDADTLVPPDLFERIAVAMADPRCLGGAVAVEYAPLERKWLRLYLAGWKLLGRAFGMAQGAAQFCRRPAFVALGGYDATIYMGEDVEFFWRLRRYAKRHGGHARLLADTRVVTSGRRFDRMSIWRTLVFTHPVVIRLTWRRRRWWKDWYERHVR